VSPGQRTAYRALGYRFDFVSGSQLAQRLVQRLYGEFECSDDGDAATAIELRREWINGDFLWHVIVDTQCVSQQATVDAALGGLEYEISRRIVDAAERLVPLHGALVRGRERALLISGVSGAGKTTLALALAARGYEVLGDDVAMLDPRDGTVRALPRCLHVDARSWDLLRDERLSVPRRFAAHGLLTPADLGGSPGARVRVGTVFMMRGSVPYEPEIKHLSQAEMVVLMESQVRWQGRTPERTLDALSRMLGRAACYSLVGGRLGATVELVAAVAGPPASPSDRAREQADAAAG
jgi:hypothetical protein